MVNVGSSSLLGLAVGERSIVCAQLANRAGRRVVRRLATFDLPPGATLEQPDAAGQALASFLRQHGFSATRAVVGVPARWLIATERDVPPADEEATRAMLRLQAERMSGGGDGGELLFDYVDGPAAGAGSAGAVKVLLVGILRRQLERIERTMDAAGLTVVAVTSTALALAGAIDGAGATSGSSTAEAGDGDASMLVLGRGGGEVVWRHNGAPRMLRHVPVSSLNGHGNVAMAALGSELRRAVALAPPTVNGKLSTPTTAPPSTNGSSPSRRLLLWDLVGLTESDIKDLSGRLGTDVHSVAAPSALGLQVEDDANRAAAAAGDGAAATFAPAMALALAGARRNISVDLAHSRLAPPPQRKINRAMLWGIVIAATLVFAIGSLFLSVQQRQSELAQLKKQLTDLADDRKAAQLNVDRISYGRGYFDQRSPVLECLREVTLAFRDNEPIYVTSLTFRENGTGQVSGKSPDQRYVLGLADRLRQDPKFLDVGKVDWRGDTNPGNQSGRGGNNGGGRDRDGTFSISFNYKDAATAGAAAGSTTQPTTPSLQSSQSQQQRQNNDRGSRRRGN